MAMNTSISIYKIKLAVSRKNRQVNKVEGADSNRYRHTGELRIKSWETGHLGAILLETHLIALVQTSKQKHATLC